MAESIPAPAMEPVPVNGHLMLDVWDIILSFLRPNEEFIPALVCKDFMTIIKRRQTKRIAMNKLISGHDYDYIIHSRQSDWCTSINPYCKTPHLVKNCILKYNNDQALLPMLFNWIYNIAMFNGYLDTLKYIGFMRYVGDNVYDSALKRKNYDFIIELINEYVPLTRQFIK